MAYRVRMRRRVGTGEQKGYGTVDSRVVAHPSTNTAWRSLTSLFGWEAVLSAQCGRIHPPLVGTLFCSALSKRSTVALASQLKNTGVAAPRQKPLSSYLFLVS